MLLPITLPTAMSAVSLNAACRLTVICGALLPSATTVKPISSGRTFMLAAIPRNAPAIRLLRSAARGHRAIAASSTVIERSS